MAHSTIVRSLLALILFWLFHAPAAVFDARAQSGAPEIVWHEWNEETLARAKREKRHILLDLYARWCHWCHFMEERTYKHSDVRALVAKGYLAVKVDQDANPDFAARYGDWGWPATIIFDPDGNEVAKLQGFLRPSLMSTILFTVRERPQDVPKLKPERGIERSETAFLSDVQRERIIGLLEETYDHKHAGWGRRLKFLQAGVIEYALQEAQRGDEAIKERLRDTLDAAMALIDPVWGGSYQYSHERDWSAPHYEKIMAFQANGIRLYTRAYQLFGDEKYLDAARSHYRYLNDHLLTGNGAFYTSQDADVDSEILGGDFYKLNAKERRALGRVPPIDTNQYARENGWAVSGLLALYAVTGKAKLLQQAERAANWVLANRALAGGGFSHGAEDKRGPYLSDTVAMGQAMLDLYMASGNTAWLQRAAAAADFIEANFKHETAGYVTSKPSAASGAFSKPYANIEENIDLARFANLLHRTLGKARHRETAIHAMRYLTSDAVTSERRFLLGIVLAERELGIEPAHITVVGRADDARTKELHAAALKLALPYKRVDRWNPANGPMLNPDITYPELDRPAAFACANGICSLPVFEAKDLKPAVERMMKNRVAEFDENKP